jgi:hypothetical protein
MIAPGSSCGGAPLTDVEPGGTCLLRMASLEWTVRATGGRCRALIRAATTVKRRHREIHDDDVGEAGRRGRGLHPSADSPTTRGRLISRSRRRILPHFGVIVDEEDPLCMFVLAHDISMSRELRRHIG